jgi:glycosidase
MRPMITACLLLCLASLTAAQDSVDVTFRYYPSGNPSVVHLPGEFNNWANNSGGTINPGAAWTMVKQPDGSWTKTVRLRVGGGTGPDASYQYKFNEGGSSSGWLADPLNPRTFGSYGNSIIHVRRPTVFHLQPVEGSVVGTDTLVLRADVFPVTTQGIDTALSRVFVDGQQAATFGSSYDAATRMLRIALPQFADGGHTFTVVAAEPRDYESRDSTRFTVRAGALQWLTRDNPRVLADDARVVLQSTAGGIGSVVIVRNGSDSVAASAAGDLYSATFALAEGDNRFVAHASKDGSPVMSTELLLHRFVDHAPTAVIQLGSSSGNINLNAVASTDPDGDDLTFHWRSEDEINPTALAVDRGDALISFPIPAQPGEYYFTLEARDPQANLGIARNYIRIPSDGGAPVLGAIDENPAWVRDAIVYEIFVPAFSSSGNFQGLIDGIPRMKELGVNTLWLMPIMDNQGSINEFNGGYGIIDFYNVDESLGTLADYDRFIDSCRANGLRVILDMTPNHTSGVHPWVEDIRKWKDYSIYRPFIEHRILGGDRGLGQSIVEDGGYPVYARYTNWSLANLNLSNPETRDAMMDVYRYWLVDRRTDGFRLDVYWGPQERYGAKVWWRPFREEIKRYKPEVFLLGETDGTGQGSEVNYADGGGGLDAGYDWNWYGQVKSTLGSGDIPALNSRTTNYSPNDRYNHYTGPNAHYFRFMENHDEERIAQMFQSNPERTKPGAAVMLTAPGIPMLYAGQEIGWRGRRDRIGFGTPPQPGFLPYYKKLIRIRNSHPALRSPRIITLAHGTAGTYAYLRPGIEGNIVVASNFRDVRVPVTLNVPQDALDLTEPLQAGRTYYLNDLSVDSSFAVTAGELASFTFSLAPFQSRIFLFADTSLFPTVTGIETPTDGTVSPFRLGTNYPNPVSSGGSTTITYSLGGSPGDVHEIGFTIYDRMGRERLRIPLLERISGTHAETLDLSVLPSGQYWLRLQSRHQRTLKEWTQTRGLTILR